MLIKSNKLNFQAALIIMHFILDIFPTIIFSLQLFLFSDLLLT